MKHVKRNILLNPGPATTTDSVKWAQVVPDICPREADFGNVMKFISNELTAIVANQNQYSTILFGGSGTAAVESILSSVIDTNDTVLIIDNGAYGKRMCEIAKVYGLNTVIYHSPLDDGIDLGALETVIRECDKKITHLAVVHHETTTGLLNDIEAIGSICKKYDLEMIVDAMSSFAAIPIDMTKMNIHYLAASSNKNIQGMAGVSFVIANTHSLELSKDLHQKNYYLHLYSQYDYFSKTSQLRFTPPVQTLYALKQAIIELKQEGMKERYNRYSESWNTLIKGISKLGLRFMIPKKHHSKLITAIYEPECSKFDFNDMHDYFYRRNFTIYPGKLNQFDTFRIANIGEITCKDINVFLSLLESYLQSIGYVAKK
ncbi:2-aminoethylphosphonate--pyruvate transaminase [Alkalihalobacillus sp. MEB130]|uniref:2-aminoethylphosphonate aminotransferase n=1 Tax=Alkalihalobacillus sp. MEB130 TaxID=2976704 RepID=UPI0028E05D1B|nr:2-aminoethylphosphonate--pyruvate transaminase [Alkalihalobacillus sp. MEB130]MDT8861221.1 2-aminoethylphosphonate--pyruvate transaminase [Alkalihalobacillus sp. MEB130]